MLVKITDFPDDMIEDLKRATGQATASKAVFFASTQFISVCAERDEAQINGLNVWHEVLRLRKIIEGARSSAALLLEKTAQGDLMEYDA